MNTEVETWKWDNLRVEVIQWARENCPSDYYYGSPQSYWSSAMSAGFVTQEEFDYAKLRIGNMWNYRGD